MNDYLAGKNIVITGAGSGIGKAIALSVAREGANIVVADYGVALDGSEPTSDIAESTAEEIRSLGVEAIPVAGDVSKMETGAQIISTAIENWGSVDGVVCVAGILRERMLFNMSEDEWDAVIAVHLKGHFTVYRHAMAAMRKQDSGGSILSTTVSFISVPILKISFSSFQNLISVCRNFPYKASFETSISFKPSLNNFFALRKLIFSPNLITTFPVFASTTSSEKFFDL